MEVMTSAHTQAIHEGNPIYLTGERIQIPVKGKRSYSVRIKVHKRRSIKPQLVKDELNARDIKERKLMQVINRLAQPQVNWVERFINKLRRKHDK